MTEPQEIVENEWRDPWRFAQYLADRVERAQVLHRSNSTRLGASGVPTVTMSAGELRFLLTGLRSPPGPPSPPYFWLGEAALEPHL